jgi:hypothetical protein
MIPKFSICGIHLRVISMELSKNTNAHFMVCKGSCPSREIWFFGIACKCHICSTYLRRIYTSLEKGDERNEGDEVEVSNGNKSSKMEVNHL